MVRPAQVKVYRQKANGALAILIPKSIREALGIQEGSRFMVYDDQGKVVLEPVERFGFD